MSLQALCHTWYGHHGMALEDCLVITLLFLKNGSSLTPIFQFVYPFHTFIPFFLLYHFPIWFICPSCHHSTLPSFLPSSLGLKQFQFLDFLSLIPPSLSCSFLNPLICLACCHSSCPLVLSVLCVKTVPTPLSLFPLSLVHLCLPDPFCISVLLYCIHFPSTLFVHHIIFAVPKKDSLAFCHIPALVLKLTSGFL